MGNGKRRRLQGLPLMTGVPKKFLRIPKKFLRIPKEFIKILKRIPKNPQRFSKNFYKFSTEFLLNNRNLYECQFVNFVPVHLKKKSFFECLSYKKNMKKCFISYLELCGQI